MKQDGMERLLSAARDYNEPPEPPREAMWQAIQAERQRRAGSRDLDARRAARERRERMRRWTPWALGLAAAATLAVGFGLGRLAERSTPVGPATPDRTAAGTTRETSLPVQLAAADHMEEAEAMLTLYRTAGDAEDREAVSDWARELLTTTRLLLDSRAGRDPQLGELLSDLELVLVQIASAGDHGGTEKELIEEGIEKRQLLTKLRTAARPLDMAL